MVAYDVPQTFSGRQVWEVDGPGSSIPALSDHKGTPLLHMMCVEVVLLVIFGEKKKVIWYLSALWRMWK